MTDTMREYHFSDEQMDQLLRLVRNKAFQVKYNPQPEDEDYYYHELANQIEEQLLHNRIYG